MSAAATNPPAAAAATEPTEREHKPWYAVIGRVASAVGLILVLTVASLMLVPSLLGYHRYVIVSGSMEPTIPTGSVIYDKDIPVADLKVKDIITFVPPPEYDLTTPVTHRIIEITQAPEDQQDKAAAGRLFRTKGDANDAPDPWRMILNHPTQDKVEHHIPYLGYVYIALTNRWVQLLVIGLPSLIIAFMIARALWREAGYGAREEREKKARAAGQAVTQ